MTDDDQAIDAIKATLTEHWPVSAFTCACGITFPVRASFSEMREHFAVRIFERLQELELNESRA